MNIIALSVFLVLAITTRPALGKGQLGSTCFYDEECDTTTTYCKNRQSCQCKENFRVEGDICIATIGARCLNSGECSSLANSDCTEETCSCRQGYVAHSTKYSCLSVASYFNAPCEIDDQCTLKFGSYSGCIASQCKCRESYHYHNNYCFPNVGLGQACTNESNCHLSETENYKITCRNSVCSCRDSFRQSDNTCIDSADRIHVALLTMVFFFAVKFLF